MKIILKETVEDLGRRGEVVDVADGYGRNYLIPQDLAEIATRDNIRRIGAERKAYLAREAKRIEESQEIADAIAKLQVSVKMKAGTDGQLFGSVSDRIITDALKDEQVTIEPKMVRIKDPIRELGVFDVTIHLHPEVDATLRLWVVEDKDEA